MYDTCTFTKTPDQVDKDSTAADIVAAKDLRQITDYREIETLCQGIVDNPNNAKQVHGGARRSLAKKIHKIYLKE